MVFDQEAFIDKFVSSVEEVGIISCSFYCERLAEDISVLLTSKRKRKIASQFASIIEGVSCWCNMYTVDVFKDKKENEFRIDIISKKVSYNLPFFGDELTEDPSPGLTKIIEVRLPITFKYKITDFLDEEDVYAV